MVQYRPINQRFYGSNCWKAQVPENERSDALPSHDPFTKAPVDYLRPHGTLECTSNRGNHCKNQSYPLIWNIRIRWTDAFQGTIFRCRPISSNWNVAVFQRGPTECINHLTFDIFNSALNAFWDLLICLLPIPVIYGLKASRGKKGESCRVGRYMAIALSHRIVTPLCNELIWEIV